ncbi:hypothetical protein D9758_014298 [Tetrapyrgos nigripes]|uniref:CDP-diacylglycerol--glycerol-3-phosphate 3-phosphatidyltransferase n=1 Tax=Tetrapyrgos nigripes TaxID=182062 RepID=A0A8H5FF50_9AGAR|nr:hypothetical protein D9758_014298 [Tetrapyrgos nigripes]
MLPVQQGLLLAKAKAKSAMYFRASLLLSSFWAQKSHISTKTRVKYDNTIRDFTSELSQRQPSFSVPANGVRILSQPSEFYALLLDMIKNAEKRIFLSSLYIGSGESELHAKAHYNCIYSWTSIVLTRPGKSSTAKILLPLLRSYPDRVHVSLFRSPSLRGILARLVPPRYNEGWGTWHAKIYGVDDELIISGANLNESYFTNRQDRYVHFKPHPALANYCFDFLKTTSTVSYRLLPAESAALTTTRTLSPSAHPYTYIQEDYAVVWSDQDTHPHYINDKYRQALIEFQSKARVESASSKPTPTPTPTLTPTSTPTNPNPEPEPDHVLLFPVIQAGQFNIREEQEMFELLFRHLGRAAPRGSGGSGDGDRPLLDLTSGYFGLSEKYQDLVLGCPEVDVRIVAASPKANGFFGSKGISGRIPEGYTYLEQRFMDAVRRVGREWAPPSPSSSPSSASISVANTSGNDTGVVQLCEWEKEGWTYHAKGLWLSPTPTSNPVLTLFGSTNLNSRSAELDTELSFVMVLPSPSPVPESESEASSTSDGGNSNSSLDKTKTNTNTNTNTNTKSDPERETPVEHLRKQLAEEVQRIREDSKEWKGGERKVRVGTKMLVGVVGGML